MSFTPKTWNTGDRVNASDMNRIEQGIADGGGGGTVFYEVTTTNFPSGNNTVGWFTYVKKSGNTYSSASLLGSYAQSMVANGNKTGVWWTDIPVPTLEDYYLVFQSNSGVTITASSGGIASTPIVVGSQNVYIVTGDFSITAKGWQ